MQPRISKIPANEGSNREWDVMWVSHLCGNGRYVGFVRGGVSLEAL